MSLSIDRALMVGVTDVKQAIAYQDTLVPAFESMLSGGQTNFNEQAIRLLSDTETLPHYPDVIRQALGLPLPQDDIESITAQIKAVVAHKLSGAETIPNGLDTTYYLPVAVIMDKKETFPRLRDKLITSVGLQDASSQEMI